MVCSNRTCGAALAAGTALMALATVPLQAWGQEDVVSGQQIQAQWVGREIVGTAPNGQRIFMRFNADGSATISVGTSGDTGTWRAHEKGYCATWVQIRRGEERCFTVVKAGINYRILGPDGATAGMINAIR
jgi:hypothetical protein